MKIKSVAFLSLILISNFALCMAGGGNENLPTHKVVVVGKDILVYPEDSEEVDAALAAGLENISVDSDHNEFDINGICHGIYTPLILALVTENTETASQRKELIQLLLTYNADINHREKVNGMMPLHRMCSQDSPEMIEELILLGAKVNARDNNGRTPISYCIASITKHGNPVGNTRAFLEAVRKRKATKKSKPLEQDDDNNLAAAEPVSSASASLTPEQAQQSLALTFVL